MTFSYQIIGKKWATEMQPLLFKLIYMKTKNKKTNPDWMRYWDNVDVKLYALIKQLRNPKK